MLEYTQSASESDVGRGVVVCQTLHVVCQVKPKAPRPGVRTMMYAGRGLQTIDETSRADLLLVSLEPEDRFGRFLTTQEAHHIALHGATVVHWLNDDPGVKLWTPTECAQKLQEAEAAHSARQADMERRQKETTERRAQNEAAFKAICPPWAKAAIVAELCEDKSDIQSDYFGHSIRRTVLLAWSKHTRDVFSEMRKAAARFEPTRHLVNADKDAEHREKYSMGGGYYLKDGWKHASGWLVCKTSLSGAEQAELDLVR